MFCCILESVQFTHILQGQFSGTGAIIWLPGNHMIAPVPVKQSWKICVTESHEYIRNHDINKTKQNKTMCILYAHGFVLLCFASVIWWFLVFSMGCTPYHCVCVRVWVTRLQPHWCSLMSEYTICQPAMIPIYRTHSICYPSWDDVWL